ncbi:hypothetical protein SLS62_005920 [Diatrype stigma]|uniref:Nephrocystin 3-like N-terminal domain-containing protein n=1 Tax=Diatrype stigma TaxID=117547 RepID=A0AAN9URZ4_9PEZI
MRVLRGRLPGLELYKRIYSSKGNLELAMQVKIAESYKAFIHFCVQATMFYNKSGTQQSRKIDGLQEGHDNDHINKIQSLLGLGDYSAEQENDAVETYRRNFEVDAFMKNQFLERMEGGRMDTLKSHHDFRQWLESEGSRLLLVVGYNHHSIRSANQCWASPIALELMNRVKEKKREDESWVHYTSGLRDEGDVLSRAVFTIVLQVLRQNRSAVQKDEPLQELHAAIQDYRQEAERGGGETAASLQKVALRALNFLDSSKTVWIILDRVDKCRDQSRKLIGRALLKTMVYLVENAKPRVRVLAVVSGLDWNIDQDEDDLGRERKNSVIQHVVYQQQL